MISINFTALLSFLEVFAVQFGLLVTMMFIATKLKRLITQIDSKNEVYQSNRAISLSTFGFYLSIILILLTSVPNNPSQYFLDIASILSIALLGIFLLTLNRWFFNLFFLNSFNPSHELNRDNISFAIFQSGGFISFSILFYFSFSGFKLDIGFISVGLIYFIVSLTTLYIFSKIFLLNRIYDYIREIQRGNIAVAINSASLFISFALLFGHMVQNVVQVDLLSITATLLYFATSSIIILFNQI